MLWEDQELNHKVGETRFPEVYISGKFLLSCAAKEHGQFLRLDQLKLDDMVRAGNLPERSKGMRIDRLCLYYRVFYSLGPGGDHYPVLGAMHFWGASRSRYALVQISPQNDWLDIMVLNGEPPPNHVTPSEAGSSGNI